MEGEKLILELLKVKDKYKNVPVYTFETNIPMMIDDVISEWNRLTSAYQHEKHYAKIGKATEHVFTVGGWIQIPLEHDIESVKDLLEWVESEDN